MTDNEKAKEHLSQLTGKIRIECKCSPSYHAHLSDRIVNEIKAMGGLALEALTHALDDENECLRFAAISILEELGEPALEALTYALDHKFTNLRGRAVRALGTIGEPALEALTYALENEEKSVRRDAVVTLCMIGEPALKILGTAVEGTSDDYVRLRATEGLGRIGDPAAHLLAIALEDPLGEIAKMAIRTLNNVNGSTMWNDIREELIIRSSGRPSEYFSPNTVATALQRITEINPRLRSQILQELCDLAYQHGNEVRERVVAVARGFGADEFASAVKVTAEENPNSAAAIMRMPDGL